jgi:hypothetical protein
MYTVVYWTGLNSPVAFYRFNDEDEATAWHSDVTSIKDAAAICSDMEEGENKIKGWANWHRNLLTFTNKWTWEYVPQDIVSTSTNVRVNMLARGYTL